MKRRKLLMIPGPIEFEPEVLRALGAPTTSHVAANFIETFGNALDMMKKVWKSPSGQPFIIAGSGTLAMDLAGANLIEHGDKALVISTGYFGERFADLLKRYGAQVTILKAPIGQVVPEVEIENALKKDNYKLLTFTHVDTSTAVKVDPGPIGKLGQKYNVLTILDGVCSVAGEEIKQDEWGIDVVLTASQKAIGVPPGLALLVVSEKAMNVWKMRKAPVANYYADWSNWLPIMNAYADRKPSYFGTPAVNLVAALEVSLKIILEEGMVARIKRHEKVAQAFREAFRSLGLKMIPQNDSVCANTLSAPYFPEGIDGASLLKEIANAGIILAGGLLPEIKGSYFRIGHMGSVNQGDVLATIGAIEASLQKCGHQAEPGIAVGAALKVLNQ